MARSHLLWLVMAAMLVIAAPAGLAATQASHTVTVTVPPINELALNGGDITITVQAAADGSDPWPVSNTLASLAWSTNQAPKKVTVSDSVAGQKFPLAVMATNVVGGVTAGPVGLTNGVSTNFVTGIARRAGTCTLQYTASPRASQGAGTDVHTVTYTLVDG